jgi:hypothetical protein
MENVVSMARTSLNSATDILGSNWKLIGAVAAACGTAAFLMGTGSGRQLRSRIQNRLTVLYGQASEQVSTGYTAIREKISDMTSDESLAESNSDFDSQIKHLQDRFRLVV